MTFFVNNEDNLKPSELHSLYGGKNNLRAKHGQLFCQVVQNATPRNDSIFSAEKSIISFVRDG